MKKTATTIAAAGITLAILTGCGSTATTTTGSDSSGGESVEQVETSWYADTYGDFEAITEKGSSDAVFPLPDGALGGRLKAEYKGDSNFIVSLLDADNELVEGPINAIGNYDGVAGFGFLSFGNPATQVQVQAQGDWSITVADIAASPKDVPASGKGDTVFLYDGDATTWTLTHNGDSNFIVNQFSDEIMPGLGINEIGSYSGAVPVTAGPSVIVLQADGGWTIE
jgi:hypothetical protein